MEMEAAERRARDERSWEEKIGCGIRRQLDMDEQKIKLVATVERRDIAGILFVAKRQKGVEHEDETGIKELGEMIAWDDASGVSLDPKEVLRSRLKEMQYIRGNRYTERY